MPNYLKAEKYAFFSYDYGGGHNLVEYVKKKNFKIEKKFFFTGPSSLILKLNNIKNCHHFEPLKNYTKVFYALSWDKKIENYIFLQKKKYNFETFLILDGWGNYKSKILKKNKNFFPDNIITFDKFSYKLIKSQIGNKSKISIENFLFKRLIKRRYIVKSPKNKKILYLTSPLIKKNYTKSIIKYIERITKKKTFIQYHPSQKLRTKTYNFEELKNFSSVYGHYSSLLIYAKFLGIKAYSINHSKKDIFKWKKYGVFKNYKIKEIYDKSFNLCFKKNTF